MGEIFVWIFVILGTAVLLTMLYDTLKCKHEWEHCNTYIIDPHTGLNVKVTYLLCKKCGKVKVLR